MVELPRPASDGSGDVKLLLVLLLDLDDSAIRAGAWALADSVRAVGDFWQLCISPEWANCWAPG